jgi:hypothetical protein
MNKLLAAVALLSFGTAYAQGSGTAAKPAAPAKTATPAKPATAPSGAAAGTTPPASGEMMMPQKPGPETEALKPFVHNVSSTGTIVAGAMGPNSPETPTKGKATCKWIDANWWAACDIEDTAGTGKSAMKWIGHWVFGYDMAAKGYRGFMVDNMGMSMPFKGTLEGSKLTWESAQEMKMPGMPSKIRITMDAAEPKAIKFTEEGFMNGKWAVRGTATHKMAGGGAK